MRAWLERSFRNRIFLTVLLVALVPRLLCDVLMTQVMIFRSEHTLRTDAQEEMALVTAQLDALLTDCGDVTHALAGSTVTRSALRRGGTRVAAVFMGESANVPNANAIYGRDLARIRRMDQLAAAAGRLIQDEIRELAD